MSKKKKGTIAKEIRESDERLKFLVASRIQRVRKHLNFTAQRLAAEMGISRTALTQIETGRNHINAVTLLKLASVLKCDIKEFFPSVPSSATLTELDVETVKKESAEAAELLRKAFSKK